MSHHVDYQIVTDLSKEHNAFIIFRVMLKII